MVNGWALSNTAAAAKSLQSCPTLCNPRDGSPPGSPVLGFSRQEHWSGLPFPSPMHESESEVAQSCPTPSDPMDCSPPGSSVHGIFQARGLEWGATAFSNPILVSLLRSNQDADTHRTKTTGRHREKTASVSQGERLQRLILLTA